MKIDHARRSGHGVCTAVVCAFALVVAAPAMAADNTATGDVAGAPASLNPSNTFTINSTTLSLAKAAFLTDGTPLVSGANVPRGVLVKFMVYVDNATPVPVDSVNVQDVLDPGFVYQAGTIKVDSSQPTGSAPAAVYAAVNGAPTLTDVTSIADVAGISGASISAGDAAGNAMVSIPAGVVWAMLFTVRVQ